MPPRLGHFRVSMALLLIIIAGFLACGWAQPEANAAQVTLRWDYTASGAAGFMLYCGPSSKNYSTRLNVGNTDTYTIGAMVVSARQSPAPSCTHRVFCAAAISSEIEALVIGRVGDLHYSYSKPLTDVGV